MVVEDEILNAKSVAQLAAYIYRDFDTWIRWRNELVHGYEPAYQDLSHAVKSLKRWRANNEINDEQLQAYLMLFLACLVESNVEGRFEKVFSEKLRSLVSSAGK